MQDDRHPARRSMRIAGRPKIKAFSRGIVGASKKPADFPDLDHPGKNEGNEGT
jgi:hypothetical protein